MKSFQPEDLRLEAGTNADVQEINALKILKNPAHRGTIDWFVESLWGQFVPWLRVGDEEAAQPGGIPTNRAP